MLGMRTGGVSGDSWCDLVQPTIKMAKRTLKYGTVIKSMYCETVLTNGDVTFIG